MSGIKKINTKGFILDLTFYDGTHKKIDIRNILENYPQPTAQKLKSDSAFVSTVKLEDGVLSWGKFSIDPDEFYNAEDVKEYKAVSTLIKALDSLANKS